MIYFSTIILIFNAIKDIVSLTQTKLFFGHVCPKLSLRVLPSFCLSFYQFQHDAAYKSVSPKKTCNHLISLKHTNLFLRHFYLKFSHMVLLLLGVSLQLLIEALLKNEKTYRSLLFFFSWYKELNKFALATGCKKSSCF